MIFRDRDDAGARLARALLERGLDRDVVVLGIPRGGVPVAAAVARALGAELGVVVARKIGAPFQPELAIGATTANGATYLSAMAVALSGTDQGYVARETEAQIREARRRETLFDGRRRPPVAGRHVVVVDDGLATGATAIAAVRSIKAAGARKVTLAIPVAEPGTVRRLASEADEVVCLHLDPDFMAVGQYYLDFQQLTDDGVKALLDRASTPTGEAADSHPRAGAPEPPSKMRA